MHCESNGSNDTECNGFILRGYVKPGESSLKRFDQLLASVKSLKPKTSSNEVARLRRILISFADFLWCANLAEQRVAAVEANMAAQAALEADQAAEVARKAIEAAKAAGEKPARKPRMSARAKQKVADEAEAMKKRAELDHKERLAETYFEIAHEVAEAACILFNSWPIEVTRMVLNHLMNFNLISGNSSSMEKAYDDLRILIKQIDTVYCEGWAVERIGVPDANGRLEDGYIIATEDHRNVAKCAEAENRTRRSIYDLLELLKSKRENPDKTNSHPYGIIIIGGKPQNPGD